MDEVGPPTVRELIGELAGIEDGLRADRGCQQGIAAAERTRALRSRQAGVIRQLRRRRAALRLSRLSAGGKP
jgi:hypothetical protein